MPSKDTFWDGKTVHAAHTNPEHDRRHVEIAVTPETANELALALTRLKQTTFVLPDGAQEVLDALNFVMVGDPVSVAKHKRMEAGKGMTPDGGHRRPTGPRYT